MIDLAQIFERVEVAIVASDPDFNIIYLNQRARKLFKERYHKEDLVGTSMAECHQPETMEKIMRLFQEFRSKEKTLSYYVSDLPGGKETVVQVPFYDGGNLAGVVEFDFESILA